MFITASNFDVVPFNIPNLDKVEDTFSDYVETKEKEALVKLLGRDFYNQFIDGLPEYTYSATVATVIGGMYAYGNDIWEALTVTTGTTPVEGADWTLIEEDNKWLKLKNGADYLISDRTYHWEGMTALLKPFIYSEWIKDNYQPISGIGAVQAKPENAVAVNPSRQISSTWNKFAELAGGCFGYGSVDTLFGYLVANEADFESLEFVEPGYKNVFNI